MLYGENVRLRPLKYGDDALFFKWRNNLEYMKFSKSFRFPKPQGAEKAWVDAQMLDMSNRSITFIMETLEDSIPFGFIQLNAIDWISRNCMFGIAIAEDEYLGKGYAKEATKAVFDYVFDILNLFKVYVEILGFNSHTVRVYTRIGFVEEGMLKKQYFWGGEYHDVGIYSLYKENYTL